MAKDSTLIKLILLYVMDKMEVPLEEDIITDLCTSDHSWMNYMDCKDAICDLEDVGFLHKRVSSNKYIYNITPDGRMCLANFYTRIPISLREEINASVKNHRMDYRRRQEYRSDYFKNHDGTYTVVLKILKMESDLPIVEIRMVVESRENAAFIHKNWQNRAGTVYGALCDNLLDG
ncbi:MAG: DUF4364 family protein [Clostridia bacterium]|nr:DUF4364 family protein [Clostridia bacterium]